MNHSDALETFSLSIMGNSIPDNLPYGLGLTDNLGGIVGMGIVKGARALHLGEVRVAAETFHRILKPDILSAAGNYAKIVGRNPDIMVKGGQIFLKGTGPFKGKVMETGLKAIDFFEYGDLII